MPNTDELVFALKTFAGAMLALCLAFWLGLDNPYWSMATAYIVAQPFTGAMRSKAVYRFGGTFIGGVAAVALVPNLVNAPVLLCLAMACWIGLCLYLSLLDRTPRAYTFMLAGYTAGIIGFPSVIAPANIFTTALTRVEEISIGIACTTLVGTVILPRALGPVLARRIGAWTQPARDWAMQALAGRPEDAQTKADRRRLAFEVADIAMMTSQLAYDTSHLQSATRHVNHLRLYMLSLMPVLSSVGDRVRQLRGLHEITPELQTVLDDCGHWVQSGNAAEPAALHTTIATLSARELVIEQSWASILRLSLLVRISELISLIRHSRAIRRHVLDGEAAPPQAAIEAEFIAASHRAQDHGLPLLSALAVIAATLLLCWFWIATAWPGGAGAAVMVAVACSFFAAQDDPAPAIRLMIRDAFISVIGAAFYIFVVLPRVETFPELMLVLLPAGLIIGVLVSRPATFGTGMVIGAFGATNLALSNSYSGNFAAYINGALGLLGGLAAALVLTRLIRSVGAAWSARRLLRAGWRDIAAAANAPGWRDRAHFTGIMLDRLGMLAPRMAAVSPGADITAADVLQDLRAGLNVIGLQKEFSGLPAAAQHHVSHLLQDIAVHYRDNPLNAARPELLADIDGALKATAPQGATQKEALMFLVGLRTLLFAEAPAPVLTPQAMEPPPLMKARA